MRVGAGKKPGFFRRAGGFCRPGGHTDPPPGTAAGHTFRLCSAKVRRAAHFSALLWKSPPGHRTFRLCSGEVRAGGASPLCREEVRRAAHFSTLLWRSRRAGLCAQPPGRGVPGEGVVRSPCVPGGDRAPLTREFPTNSGVGVSAPKGIKKTVPKDGEGDDGMRLLSDVGLVAAGGLIWNPHNDQPLIQRGKQIQFAEVIPRF